EVIRIKAGDSYKRVSETEYEIRAEEKMDFEELVKDVVIAGEEGVHVVHLWSIGGEGEWRKEVVPERFGLEERFGWEQERGFYSLLYLAQAFAKLNISIPIKIDVICDKLHQVGGEETISPEKATLLAFCKVIPQEAPNISCRSIDIIL